MAGVGAGWGQLLAVFFLGSTGICPHDHVMDPVQASTVNLRRVKEILSQFCPTTPAESGSRLKHEVG
jgi:hypothetical protein